MLGQIHLARIGLVVSAALSSGGCASPVQTVSTCELVSSAQNRADDGQFGRTKVGSVAPWSAGVNDFLALPERAPDLPVRGALTELLPPARKDLTIFEGYIRAIARAGANTLVLYHMPEHVHSLRSGKDGARWWSWDELSAIASYARARGIAVIPGISSKYNARDFPDRSRGGAAGFYDPFDSKSYEELFGLYQTLLDLYRPAALLIGHDEIEKIGWSKPTGWSDARVLIADVKRISSWLRARNIRTLMFGDMLLDKNAWPIPVSANSNNPQLASVDTHLALEELPRDIVILDWQYAQATDHQSIAHFRQKGFEVWGVAWNDPRAAVSLARSVVRHQGAGLVVSDWGFWPTLSPAALTLYGIKAGYDSSIEVRSEGEDAAIAFAGEIRGWTAAHQSLRQGRSSWRYSSRAAPGRLATKPAPALVPIDLTPAFRAVAMDDPVCGVADLRAVRVGLQHFSEVPFEIIAQPDTTAPRFLSVTGPARVSVPLRKLRADCLAFLQTMVHPEPRMVVRPAGRYQVVYSGGRRQSFALLEGFNTTDVRAAAGLRTSPWGFSMAPDILLGSFLGWRGPSASGMPMNLQVLLWHNPDPAGELERLELLPNEGVTLVLMALSAGQGACP